MSPSMTPCPTPRLTLLHLSTCPLLLSCSPSLCQMHLYKLIAHTTRSMHRSSPRPCNTLTNRWLCHLSFLCCLLLHHLLSNLPSFVGASPPRSATFSPNSGRKGTTTNTPTSTARPAQQHPSCWTAAACSSIVKPTRCRNNGPCFCTFRCSRCRTSLPVANTRTSTACHRN